ncbi:MAG TPA: dipeptidase [Actinomycetota bacterium]|nr:dipeptidase [Actinomycetota bacterium]
MTELFVADAHNDLVLLIDHHRKHGDPDYFGNTFIPQLRAGGVRLQVAPIFVDPEYSPEGALRRSLWLTELMLEEMEKNSDDVALCLTGDDIDAAIDAGKIAFVLGLEGCEQIGADVELLSTFFRLGGRTAMFTHFGRTLLADGSAEDETGSRLTTAGVAAVELMESLGMLVDVSHLNMAGTDHVLEIATRPVIASHSSARALCDIHRNLSDERIKAIAATGGVVGVNFFPLFIDAENATLDRLIDHIEHVATVAGIDHVGLGPDFIKEIANTIDIHFPGIDLDQVVEGTTGTPDDFPIVADALAKRGLDDQDIAKIMGQNFLRVFRAEIGIPAVTR